jgi:carboxypeptidase C (cathepsin A)
MNNRRAAIFLVICYLLGNLAVHAEGSVKQVDSTPEQSVTEADISMDGRPLHFRSVAGTLLLKDDSEAPMASVFYVAYSKIGVPDASRRPVTFLYNGGPGAASLWLHISAFGPRRVQLNNDAHTQSAPYQLVDNRYTLLDATDLVFIDAPGTGFSRIVGNADPKDVYATDPDARLFAEFIKSYLSASGRWNSPKFLLGESYGAIRSTLVAEELQKFEVDINGLILLSALPNADICTETASLNPGIDLPYALTLPTQAAIAWYHHRLPGTWHDLESVLREAERFATDEYLPALEKGDLLDPKTKEAIADKIHEFTGLPIAYILRTDLRIPAFAFSHELLADSKQMVGLLDGRYAGPWIDPVAPVPEYDPAGTAIASANLAAFNDYVRAALRYGGSQDYIRFNIDVFRHWNWNHVTPGTSRLWPIAINILPDLATAMAENPDLKVMVNVGYFDLETPYFATLYGMHHLPAGEKLRKQIEYAYYPSGHAIYTDRESLKALHDRIAKFIVASSPSAFEPH